MNKSAKSYIIVTIILLVLIISLSYFVLAGNGSQVEKIEHNRKIVENEGVIISAKTVEHCSWKPDSINDGYKICNAIIEGYNPNYTLTVDVFKFLVDKEAQVKDKKYDVYFSTQFEYYTEKVLNESCIGECINETELELLINCEENCSYEVERKRFYNWTYLEKDKYKTTYNDANFAYKINFEFPQYESAHYDFEISYKKQGGEEIPILLDPNVSACGTLNVSHGVYTLNTSISTSGTCFIVGEERYGGGLPAFVNITVDFNGYNITGDGTGQGILLGDCINVTIENGSIYDFEDGIRIWFSEYSTINNMTIAGNTNNGIYDPAGYGHNTYTNNNISNNVGGFGYGIYIETDDGNTFQNNTINSNHHGLVYISSNNNLAENNIMNDNLYYGIYTAGPNNIYINNTANNNGWRGLQIRGGSYNRIQNQTLYYNTRSELGLDNYASLNNFTDLYINETSNTENWGSISIWGGSFDNIFIDSVFNTNQLYVVWLNESSTNNIFINCTYNQSKEHIEDSNSELIRKWYFDLNLIVFGCYEADVELYATDDMDILIDLKRTINQTANFSEILTEYVNGGGTKTYYYPTISVTHERCYQNTRTYNLSTNIIKDDNITLEQKPPKFSIPFTGPSSTSTTPEPEIIYIPENKTYCGDLICQKEGNDFEVKENFWNCPQDCPGAIGENFDEFIYSFTKYCWDGDPSTICFWTQQLFAITPGVGVERIISCGDRICEGFENSFNCLEDCGRINIETLIKNCLDDEETTPCFFDTNLAIYVLFGGFGLFLALSMIKIKIPGERRKLSGFNYIRLKLKKRRRWRR